MGNKNRYNLQIIIVLNCMVRHKASLTQLSPAQLQKHDESKVDVIETKTTNTTMTSFLQTACNPRFAGFFFDFFYFSIRSNQFKKHVKFIGLKPTYAKLFLIIWWNIP